MSIHTFSEKNSTTLHQLVLAIPFSGIHIVMGGLERRDPLPTRRFQTHGTLTRMDGGTL
jgi:hypothetical protein